jgi:hypothetical protein
VFSISPFTSTVVTTVMLFPLLSLLLLVYRDSCNCTLVITVILPPQMFPIGLITLADIHPFITIHFVRALTTVNTQYVLYILYLYVALFFKLHILDSWLDTRRLVITILVP